jgi:predicted transcriptional regulator
MADSDDKALVAQILSSYLSNNSVAPMDLPSVIATVQKAMRGESTAAPVEVPVAEIEKRAPAVPVKKSILPEALICLCCGEKFKSLKRHLSTEHKLTPDEYREMFDLRSDYPMVAPEYAERRSHLARSLGLGRKPGFRVNPEPKPAFQVVPETKEVQLKAKPEPVIEKKEEKKEESEEKEDKKEASSKKSSSKKTPPAPPVLTDLEFGKE